MPQKGCGRIAIERSWKTIHVLFHREPIDSQGPPWVVAPVRNRMIVCDCNVLSCSRKQGVPLGAGQGRRLLKGAALGFEGGRVEATGKVGDQHPEALGGVPCVANRVGIVGDLPLRHRSRGFAAALAPPRATRQRRAGGSVHTLMVLERRNQRARSMRPERCRLRPPRHSQRPIEIDGSCVSIGIGNGTPPRARVVLGRCIVRTVP